MAGVHGTVPMLEWRNWQTHWTQNPAPFTGHEGSTPSSSTNPRSARRSRPLPAPGLSGIRGNIRRQPRRRSSELTGCIGRCAGAKRVALTGIVGLWAAVCAFGSEARQDSGNAVAKPTLEQGLGEAKPDWLSLSGEFRVRYENRQALGYQKGSNDGYALVRTRLNIGIEPAKWLRFGFQGQDARAPGIRDGLSNIGAFRDGFDVRQAYAEFGTSDSVVSLTVGRQLLAYGDQRLVGALDWANTSRAFDAVKLVLRRPGAKVDIFSASVVQNDPERRINQSAEGNNLHGIYAALENLIPGSTVEPYFLWQTTPVVVNELNIRGDLDRYTTGVRAWAEALGPWDYNMAIVGQQGSAAGALIQAWGYYLELGYSIDRQASPRLYVHYNFGSGDEDPEDGRIGGFVDLYPTAHRWYGYNDLVGWRNIRNLRLGAQVRPHAKLGLQFDLHSFWLVSRHDALYNVGGRLSVAPPPEGAANTKIGDEVNVTFTWPLTELISLGGGVGYLFPGPFLKANSPGVGNTFSYLVIAYSF